MTAVAAAPSVGGGGRHHAYTVPFGLLYRAACSCGWRGEYANRKRQNAVRIARRHAQEAQA